MEISLSLDPAQGLSQKDELECIALGAELGYSSAWTPSGGDGAAFDRCLAWHQATGLPTGIAVVPASAQPPEFYAQEASRVWEGSQGRFVLGVGSGQLAHPVREMAQYLEALRQRLPPELPIYLAALGPGMLRLAGELADGVLLNWCSRDQVAMSRLEVERAAAQVGRPTPPLAAYIRTAVDPDPAAAARVLGEAMLAYALGPGAYRRHFERMGFADELAGRESSSAPPSPRMLSAVGAWGLPGAVRQQFLRLAQGLDLAIVRVLVREPGDFASGRRVLEECRPD